MDTSGFFATGDSIKRMELRKIEILSFIKTEKERVLDEQKQKDTLTKLLSEIDTAFVELSQP